MGRTAPDNAGRKPARPAGAAPACLAHGLPQHDARPCDITASGRISRRSAPSASSTRSSATFAAGCARPGFRLVHYSLQGNQRISSSRRTNQIALGRGMMAIGARLARAVNRVADRSRAGVGRSLSRSAPADAGGGAHGPPLRAPECAAARGKGASRATGVRLDPASSARWFDGWMRGTYAARRSSHGHCNEDPPVARARTWLLTVGWRRYGLLDPADVPG